MTLEELQAGIVIPIDKPRQWTSFQVVSKVKSAIRHAFDLKKIKIGHAGTLDPLATGLLLVCVGKSTKNIPLLQEGIKVYSGTMVIGATTPCHDMEQAIDHFYPFEHITPEAIEQARRQFEGDISHMPPMFSAVKIDGQRAYQIARQAANSQIEKALESEDSGEPAPQPTPKTIHIDKFEITAFRPGTQLDTHPQETTNRAAEPLQRFLYDHPQGSIPGHLPQIDFRITCGKGTYIRSIARDFGIALGSGAFLASLRREQVGDYTIQQAYPLKLLAETFFNQQS